MLWYWSNIHGVLNQCRSLAQRGEKYKNIDFYFWKASVIRAVIFAGGKPDILLMSNSSWEIGCKNITLIWLDFNTMMSQTTDYEHVHNDKSVDIINPGSKSRLQLL